MPRAGWAAAGAVVVALVDVAAQAFGAQSGTVGAGAGLAIGSAAALALRRSNRTGALAMILAAALVAARIATMPVAAPSPLVAAIAGGESPTSWLGAVVGVGSPRDGQQIATLELRPTADPAGSAAPDRPAIRVAATLPRYPAIRPGLIVATRGRIEALADDDYGRYLTSTGVEGTLRTTTLTIVGDAGGPGATIEAIRRGG